MPFTTILFQPHLIVSLFLYGPTLIFIEVLLWIATNLFRWTTSLIWFRRRGFTQKALGRGHCNSHSSITGNIDRRSHHIDNTVDSENQCDSLNRNLDRLKYDDQHQNPRPRYSGRSDRCERCRQYDGELLTQCQIHPQSLSDKDGSHRLIETGSIHIDRSPYRQDKTANLFIYPQALDPLHRDRQSRQTGAGTEAQQDGRLHCAHEFDPADPRMGPEQQVVDDRDVQQHTDRYGQRVPAKGTDQVQGLQRIIPRQIQYNGRHQRKDPIGCGSHDQIHDTDQQIIQSPEQIDQNGPFFSGYIDQSDPKQDRDEDHLDHVGVVGCSPHYIERDHIHKKLQRRPLSHLLCMFIRLFEV